MVSTDNKSQGTQGFQGFQGFQGLPGLSSRTSQQPGREHSLSVVSARTTDSGSYLCLVFPPGGILVLFLIVHLLQLLFRLLLLLLLLFLLLLLLQALPPWNTGEGSRRRG